MSEQYPVDPVTLRINGVDWSYWKSLEITRQIDAIAGSFSLGLADKWEDGAQSLPIAAGMTCEVLIGSESVINGYIDKVNPAFTAREHGITVSGRDKTGDLVDCSAVQSPGEWKSLTAQQIAESLAKPFGIKISVEGDVGAPFEVFKLEPGETIHNAIDRAFKQREILCCPDGKGGLTIIKVGGKESSVPLVQGKNILTASLDCEMTDRFSDYIVQAQKPGSDKESGQKACAVTSTVKDAAVKRYRPLIIRAENSADSAVAQQRAAWECSVRAARAVTLTCTVQGFRQVVEPGQSGGKLWDINALTHLSIPYFRLDQKLLISKVSFRRDLQSGSITTLELKDPKAFQPEPKEKEQNDSKSQATGKAKAQKVGGNYTVASDQDIQTRMATAAETENTRAKK